MATSRTIACRRKPVLGLRHLATPIAEKCNAQVEETYKNNGWQKDEQGERMMPLDRNERDKRPEEQTRNDRAAPEPKPLLLG